MLEISSSLTKITKFSVNSLQKYENLLLNFENRFLPSQNHYNFSLYEAHLPGSRILINQLISDVEFLVHLTGYLVHVDSQIRYSFFVRLKSQFSIRTKYSSS